MIAELWFISMAAQREIQMGDVCFGFVREIPRVLFLFVYFSRLLETTFLGSAEGYA